MATIRQKLAVKKVLKGTPIKHAMVEAGYAASTADTTGKLTRSKGFKELIDKYISEDKLAKVHSEGLKATRHQPATEWQDEREDIPDYATRFRYLETGYKLRGRLIEKEQTGNVNILIIAPETQSRYAISPEPVDNSA